MGRHGSRDAALIVPTSPHGLRVSEAVALRWDQLDLKQGLLHVNRLKNGVPSTHPPRGYLGHKNIQHTVRDTELAPDRFKNFWRD